LSHWSQEQERIEEPPSWSTAASTLQPANSLHRYSPCPLAPELHKRTSPQRCSVAVAQLRPPQQAGGKPPQGRCQLCNHREVRARNINVGCVHDPTLILDRRLNADCMMKKDMSSLMWPGSPGGKLAIIKMNQSKRRDTAYFRLATGDHQPPPPQTLVQPVFRETSSERPLDATFVLFYPSNYVDLHLPSHFNLNGPQSTMTPSRRFQYRRTLLLALLSSTQPLVAAQDCYYPNGDLSTTDAPCSSEEGAACCPLNWQCLDNGLCYLDNQKYFGRYTCTDKSWQSSACPGFCTNAPWWLIDYTDKTDYGAQAVQQCSDHGNQYCCDQNRDVNNVCCDRNDDSLYFALPQGKPTATIAQLGAPAAAASGDSNESNNNPSNKNKPEEDEPNQDEPSENEPVESDPPAVTPQPVTPQPSTTPPRPTASAPITTSANSPQRTQNNINSQTPTTTSSAPATITSSSTASSNGVTSLVLLTSVITTAPSPAAEITSPTSASASTSSSSNVAAIGGGVGGGVAALLFLSCLAFVLFRRHKRRKQLEHEEATVHPPTTFLADQKVEDLQYMYKGQSTPGTTTTAATGDGEMDGSPELDGREIIPPVAMGG
ncbi:MAG: hypothetical protein Q9210_007464, partial [Variospora velana]